MNMDMIIFMCMSTSMIMSMILCIHVEIVIIGEYFLWNHNEEMNISYMRNLVEKVFILWNELFSKTKYKTILQNHDFTGWSRDYLALCANSVLQMNFRYGVDLVIRER